MGKRRQRDVINVNRSWTAFTGTRMCGFSVGIVYGADYQQAMQQAKARFPDERRMFVDPHDGNVWG